MSRRDAAAARGGSGRSTALLLAVEHAVDDFYQGVVPALVPFLVLQRGYGYSKAGGIVLAATLLSSLAQPLFGVLADARALAWLRRAGMLTAAAGIACVGVLQPYWMVCAAVLVSGLGIAAYHPEAARAVRATGTADRGMGWFTFGGLAGFAAGPPVVGVLISAAGLGWTPLLAVPAVVMALVTYRYARSSASLGAFPGDGSAGRTEDNDWRRFRWLTAVVVSRSVLYYGITTFLAVYLVQHVGWSPTEAAYVLTAFTGLGALAALSSGRVVEAIGRVGALRVAYLAAVPLLALVVVSTDPVLVVAGVGALGVVLNLPVPVHTTLGQHYLPHNAGLAAAVTLGLAVSAGGAASPVLGALADRRGLGPTMSLLLVLPVVSALCTLPLAVSRPRSGSR